MMSEDIKRYASEDYVDEKILTSQSDYAENDPAATSYIKNRPFYEYEEEIDIMPETEITFSGGSADIDDYVDFSNHEDGTYYLAIDGVTYEGTLDYTGNPVYDYMGVFSPYTWEFGCTLVNSDQPDGAVVARVYRKATSIVTIDEKYLPEMPWKLTEDGGALFSNRSDCSVNWLSVAFGQEVHATGHNSFAGGSSAVSTAFNSFAFGAEADSNGDYSAAIGCGVTADGECSVAIGSRTIASNYGSFVSGRYNIEDTDNKYLRIVGNGTGSKRSNAYTLDVNGNAWFAGDVYVGGTNQDVGSKMLAYDVDYDENKETQPGYIKNRPFYTEYSVEESSVVSYETSNRYDGTFRMDGKTVNGVYGSNATCLQSIKEYAVNNGYVWLIFENISDQECLVTISENTDGSLTFIDVDHNFSGVITDSGDTSLLTILNYDFIPISASVSGKMCFHKVTEFVKTIDEKYIPDTIATVNYVDTSVANIVNSAPEALNTLNELATALGNDENFATTVATQIGEKASTVDLITHTTNTSNPHEVTKAQVGLGNVANVLQYSADNPPPYPVTSVNGQTGAVAFEVEEWTFTLEDGSTVTKRMLIG